jgi:uncharacterized protein DUF268
MRHYISLGSLKRIATHPQLVFKLPKYFSHLRAYRRLETERTGSRLPLRLYPCLEDSSESQPSGTCYFYQDCWAARQVFREKPPWVVDVGSTVLLVGILSQFTPCTSVDFRPIQSELAGLKTVAGTVLDLPFENGEVPCLTSMCVLEHIGLGRYGDPLDPTGTEGAAKEIARVIAAGGIVVYSLPMGNKDRLEFNAHRQFSYERARSLFPQWDLIDSCLLTPEIRELRPELLCDAKDAVGCFCLRKPRDIR